MFGIQNYSSFLAAVIIFQAVPGPGTITILNTTARHGIGAGMRSVLGTLAGDFLYMAAAVAGIAAVMNSNGFLFDCLQLFGAAYLCWIGLKLILQRSYDSSSPSGNHSGWDHFGRAFAVSLTNPKVILFFVAFFPLFLHRDSSAPTLVLIMFHVTLLSFFYQSGLVLLGNAIAIKLKSHPLVRRIANRLAGVALIGFGFKLAMHRR